MFKYTYHLELKLARVRTTLSLLSKKNFIEQCVHDYNKTIMQMYTAKRLTLTSLSQSSIFITLESETELTSVGKSLRTFSILLLRDEDFSNAVSSNGQLLRVIQLPHIKTDSTSFTHATEIDDLTFLKALLDYVYQPRDLNTTAYKRKKAAFEQMKRLALDTEFFK